MTVLTFPIVNTGVSQNLGIAKPIPAGWDLAITAYLSKQSAAGRPKTTLGTRRSHLARLARAVGGPFGSEPFDLDPDELSYWFGEQKHWEIETRRSYRNTIRSFYQWAYYTGRLDKPDLIDALPKVKASKPCPRPAPDDVWNASVKAADARVDLMLDLAAVGLRRGEVALVSTDDVSMATGGYELLVHGKGNKKRIIPINEDLARRIMRGARAHTPMAPRHGWLFPGADNGHLSARWVGTLCSRVMPGVWTMHTIRHRCATKAYNATKDIRAVQELLGHESVATTQIYTKKEDDAVRAAMMAAVA